MFSNLLLLIFLWTAIAIELALPIDGWWINDVNARQIHLPFGEMRVTRLMMFMEFFVDCLCARPATEDLTEFITFEVNFEFTDIFFSFFFW